MAVEDAVVIKRWSTFVPEEQKFGSWYCRKSIFDPSTADEYEEKYLYSIVIGVFDMFSVTSL